MPVEKKSCKLIIFILFILFHNKSRGLAEKEEDNTQKENFRQLLVKKLTSCNKDVFLYTCKPFFERGKR